VSDFGLRTGVEGEKEFRAALKDIQQSFKLLGSEMQLVTSQFDKNDKSVQALTSRNTVLNKEICDAEKQTGDLGKALDEAGKDLDGIGKETKKLGTEMDDTGKKTSIFGEVLQANLAADAIKADLSAIVDMVGVSMDGVNIALAQTDAVITEWDDNGMPLIPALFRGKRGIERCILKQADVVMLMCLLPHDYDMETQSANFNYYEQRTLHRSSLSPSIHCLLGLRVGDDKRAYAYLERSAYVDVRNNQGNTREGLHAASAGGTWQCVTLGFCGMGIGHADELEFSLSCLIDGPA